MSLKTQCLNFSCWICFSISIDLQDNGNESANFISKQVHAFTEKRGNKACDLPY